jgi:hypothetical protein
MAVDRANNDANFILTHAERLVNVASMCVIFARASPSSVNTTGLKAKGK